MAQRLVRRLCTHCRESYRPHSADVPADFPFDRLADRPLYRAVGCRECRGVGYRGRIGIYELLTSTDVVRQLAHDRASTWEIKSAALAEGLSTLRDDGWTKAISGETSVDEVARNTKSDRRVKE